jgi:hypothetical protein
MFLQLLASAEGQRDEYAKSLSELREQYQRISSKNQDIDPLVHEELKSKFQALEKLQSETLEKLTFHVAKLHEKKTEQAKLKHDLADMSQKLQQSQTALSSSQQTHQQQQQHLQLQLQNLQQQLQESKQLHLQQQTTDKFTISQLEKSVQDYTKELAVLRAAAASAAAQIVSDGFAGKAIAQPTLAQLDSVVPIMDSQRLASSGVVAVPASRVNTDVAAESQSSGDKRSGDSDAAGAKQAKRVLNASTNSVFLI